MALSDRHLIFLEFRNWNLEMADEVESDLITDLRRQLENAQVEKQLAMAKMEQAAEHGLQGQKK